LIDGVNFVCGWLRSFENAGNMYTFFGKLPGLGIATHTCRQFLISIFMVIYPIKGWLLLLEFSIFPGRHFALN